MHTAVRPQVFHQVDALHHTDAAGLALPAVACVVGTTPQRRTGFRTPFPGLAHTPLTNVEHDVTAGTLQCLAHRAVARKGFARFGGCVAVVIFQQVDAPKCILRGVSLFVAIRTESPSARLFCSVGVDTKLQAFAVHIVHRGFHALGEFGGVFFRCSVTVARRSMPKVVDDEVVVAGFFQSELIQLIGRGAHHLIRDVAFEHVPRNPAHHRTGSGIALVDGEGHVVRNQRAVGAVGQNQIHAIVISAGSRHTTFHAAQIRVPMQPFGQSGHHDRRIGGIGLDALHERTRGSGEYSIGKIEFAVLYARRFRAVVLSAFLVGHHRKTESEKEGAQQAIYEKSVFHRL